MAWKTISPKTIQRTSSSTRIYTYSHIPQPIHHKPHHAAHHPTTPPTTRHTEQTIPPTRHKNPQLTTPTAQNKSPLFRARPDQHHPTHSPNSPCLHTLHIVHLNSTPKPTHTDILHKTQPHLTPHSLSAPTRRRETFETPNTQSRHHTLARCRVHRHFVTTRSGERRGELFLCTYHIG
jgi:hypothetical protein